MAVHSSHHEGAGKAVFLPARVEVAEIIQSRYGDQAHTDSMRDSHWYVPELIRPLSWDQRVEGMDIVRTTSGETIKLLSSGMQSVPKPGWVLMLTGGDANAGYRWTLYGIPPKSAPIQAV